jgi:hypothetical protein
MTEGGVLPEPCHAYTQDSSTTLLPRFSFMLASSASHSRSCFLFWMRRTLTNSCVARDTVGTAPSGRGLSNKAVSATV